MLESVEKTELRGGGEGERWKKIQYGSICCFSRNKWPTKKVDVGAALFIIKLNLCSNYGLIRPSLIREKIYY